MKEFRGKYKFTPSCIRVTQKIYNASIMLEYRLGIFMQNYRSSFLSFFFTIVRIFCMKWLNNSILQNKVRNLYCELMNLTYYFLMKLNYGYLFKDMLKVRWGIFFYYIIFELNVFYYLNYNRYIHQKYVHSFGLFTDFMISKINQLLFEFIC